MAVTAQCTINKDKKEVEFIGRGIHHCTHDALGKKDLFWIKNEILPHIDKYIINAKIKGRKNSDVSHNVNKETVKLKKNTDYFYYLEIAFPNGKNCCLHIGHYKNNYHVQEKAGKYYIYSITTYIPKNIESI